EEVIALAAIEAAGLDQPAPAPLENLHRAERPARALRLEGLEVGRREPLAEHRIDVARLVAGVHETQTQFRVFADAPFRPAAGRFERGATHQRHGAVLDDGIALVAMMHADAEKTVELPVAHALEGAVLEIAVRLRR